MPFQKGLQNYNIFFIYANLNVEYLTFFAEKAIFTPYLFAHVRKNNYLCRDFDNCTLQNNTINPILFI